MKNIKHFIFIFILFFVNVFYVHASCTDEEISMLKEEVKNIKITYKHMGKVEQEEGYVYNLFEVKVKNISDDFFISLYDGAINFFPDNGEIVEEFNNGTWNFEIYSNKCDEKITEIEVFIPKYNLYALDPLCEGVDGDDFPLCGKYYEHDVSYDNFKERVEYYRLTYKIKNHDESEDTNINLIINKVGNFIIKYKLYLIELLSILLIVIIIVIIIKRRKKRGVLE